MTFGTIMAVRDGLMKVQSSQERERKRIQGLSLYPTAVSRRLGFGLSLGACRRIAKGGDSWPITGLRFTPTAATT